MTPFFLDIELGCFISLLGNDIKIILKLSDTKMGWEDLL